MKKTSLALSLGLALIVAASAVVRAHEKVKLTGYMVDKMCASGHLKDTPEKANAFAAKHSGTCALMPECTESGFGIITDGKWYPFDAKGNELAKTIFQNTKKKDHIGVTVEGMEHDGKIMVETITETE
jgi:hypothetical protein